MINAGVFGGIISFAEHLDRSGEADLFLFHDHLYSGMIILGNFPEFFGSRSAFAHIDFLALELFIGLSHFKFFGDLHGGHDFITFGVVKGNLIAFVDAVGIFFAG